MVIVRVYELRCAYYQRRYRLKLLLPSVSRTLIVTIRLIQVYINNMNSFWFGPHIRWKISLDKKQVVTWTSETSFVELPSHLKVMETVAFSFEKIYTSAFFVDKLLLMKPLVSLRT